MSPTDTAMGCLGREGAELPLEEQRKLMETQGTAVPADRELTSMPSSLAPHSPELEARGAGPEHEALLPWPNCPTSPAA